MNKRICSIYGCGEPHKGYGYCRKHYRRWKKHGDPTLGAEKPRLLLSDEERRERTRQNARDWYAANRERALANVRAYRLADPERKRRQDREYRAANHDRIDTRVRQWHAANPERIRDIKTKSAARPEHVERKKAYNKEWATANREKRREVKAAYIARNIERVRAQGRQAAQLRKARRKLVQIIPFTADQWDAKVAYWGDRCWHCGGDWTAMDHVKPISVGGAHMLCNLRPICKPCNSSKWAKWPYPATIQERKSA